MPPRKQIARRKKPVASRFSRRNAKREGGSRKKSVVVARPLAPPGSGLAPGMQLVNPYLAVANVSASMDFLERALGFTRGVVLAGDDGQLRYAEMRHGNCAVMLIRKGDATAPTGGAAALYAYVDDVDAQIAIARQAGAGVEAAEDKAWGDRTATVTDPDGYRWVLATFKKLVPFT